MAKSDKLYKDSPSIEKDEEGNASVKRPSDKEEAVTDVGEDGSSAEMGGEASTADHAAEHKSITDRHEEEQKAMHERHRKDFKEFHARMEKKKTEKK